MCCAKMNTNTKESFSETVTGNKYGDDISIPMPWGSISGKTFGRAENIPVLVIHGRCDNLESFRNLIPLLPLNFFYVCIDMPGHGKSSHAQIGYIVEPLWYVMCAKRLIDHFQWRKVHVIGHSMGGYVCLFLTALYPELVTKMVMLDTIIYDHTPPSNTAKSLRNEVFEPTFALEKRSNMDKAPTYSFAEILQKMKDSRLTEVECSQIESMVERNIIKVGSDKYKFSFDQRLKTIGPVHFTLGQLDNVVSAVQCPTLVILGKNSLVTTPHEKLKATPLQRNRNVTLHVVDGDHDVHITHPERVAQLLVPFLLHLSDDLKKIESKL